MSSLYELTTQQLELKQKLMTMDLDEQTVLDTLEGSAGELEAKFESYGFVICDEESLNNAMTGAINKMIARRDAHRKQIDGIKDRLLTAMVACETHKIDCPFFTIAVQNNPQSVEIYNDKLIPEEYMKTPEPKPPVAAPDKRLMLADMKAGKEIDGCKLTTNQRLVIK